MKVKKFDSWRAWPLCLLCLIAGALTSCDSQEEVVPDQLRVESAVEAKAGKTTTYYGPATPLGQGIAKAWVEMTRDGQPVAVGIDLSAKAAANLPDEPRVYMLQLPKQGESTLYKFVMLDWNPSGHAPDMFYGLPHFDFHFYMTPMEEVESIEGGLHPHTPQFAADFIPASYITGLPMPNMGEAVPGMGVHWIDVNAPELNGQTFTKTFIYGSYNNEVTFHEPMITLAYLQGLVPNVPAVTPIPQPLKVQMSGYHPQTYTVEYDPTPGTYTISLTALKYRSAVNL